MKAPRGGSTMRQMAYAKRIFGAQGKNKKQIALDVGYAPHVANSLKSHVENTDGFHNAMMKLAADSNNLALAAMTEFQRRGFDGFSNKDLVGALNAIGSAWSKFNASRLQKDAPPENNKLRTVILQRIENQTVNTPPAQVIVGAEESVLPDNEDF